MSPYVIPGLRHKMPLSATAESIIDHVCLQRGIGYEQLKSKSRFREYVQCRNECMYIMKTYCKNITLEQIGRLLCRDHTTVIHGLRAIQDRMDTEPDYRAEVIDLSSSLITRKSL